MPTHLSCLTIVNLAYNGVPTKILTMLMEEGLTEHVEGLTEHVEGLTEHVEGLTQWHGAGAMPLLWHAVNKVSDVSFQQLWRTAAGIQCALGLTR